MSEERKSSPGPAVSGTTQSTRRPAAGGKPQSDPNPAAASSRRKFVKSVAAGSALAAGFPALLSGEERGAVRRTLRRRTPARRVAPSDRVGLAVIGAGGMGMADVGTALRIPGVELVAAINRAGERCAVRIHSHENLTAGKMLTWLNLVHDTAAKIIENHKQQCTGGDIDIAEAVAWAGSEAGLYTIVLEPSTLRRADIVNEILTHPDVAHAPPAQEQMETPYVGFDTATQTSMGTTRRDSRGPDISW